MPYINTAPLHMPPQRLYKYFSPDRHAILQDGLIRFTQPGDLNDPFELRIVFKNSYSQKDMSRLVDEAVEKELAKLLSTVPAPLRAGFRQAAKVKVRAGLQAQQLKGSA